MNLFFEPNGKVVGQWKGNKVRVMDAAMFNKNEPGVTVVREDNKLLLVKGGYVIANVTQEGSVSEVSSYPYFWKPKTQEVKKQEVKVEEPVSVSEFSFSNYTTEVDDFFERLASYDPFNS